MSFLPVDEMGDQKFGSGRLKDVDRGGRGDRVRPLDVEFDLPLPGVVRAASAPQDRQLEARRPFDPGSARLRQTVVRAEVADSLTERAAHAPRSGDHDRLTRSVLGGRQPVPRAQLGRVVLQVPPREVRIAEGQPGHVVEEVARRDRSRAVPIGPGDDTAQRHDPLLRRRDDRLALHPGERRAVRSSHVALEPRVVQLERDAADGRAPRELERVDLDLVVGDPRGTSIGARGPGERPQAAETGPIPPHRPDPSPPLLSRRGR